MFNYFKKLSYILGKETSRIPILMIIFVFASIVDVFGVIIIGPFTRVITKPELISRVSLLNNIFSFLNVQTYNQKIAILSFGLILTLFIQFIILFYSQLALYRTSAKIQEKVLSQLFYNYINVPYKFILSESSAALTSFMQESEMAIKNNITSLLQILSNSIMLFLLLIALVKTSVLLMVITVVIFFVVFIVLNLINNIVRKAGKIRILEKKKNITTINHTFGGFKETRIIGCENYFQKQIRQQYRKSLQAEVKVGVIGKLPSIITKTSLVIVLILFITISITFFDKDPIALTPVLSIFAVAGVRISPSFNTIVQSLTLIKNNSFALDGLYLKLKEIEKINQEQRKDEGKLTKEQTLCNSFDEIALVEVDYTYPGSDKPSLEKVSFSLRKGESIGIIGKSGAGKTTLIDVILGLLQPDRGDIEVDGLSIYKNLRGWQDMVGYIPQTIFLTEDTIEKNIAFGVPEKLIDHNKIAQVLKMTELEELVAGLPDGVKTDVGERGVRLSGGQRQRIGIARALYHDREILVLDEATSALDNQTETLITEAIKSLSGNKTMIIIAHRLSTLRHCDRLCLLEKGRLVKQGSYDEVVSEYESRYQSNGSVTQEMQ